MRAFWLSTISLVSFGFPAIAADLPAAPPPVRAVAPVYNWTGFYIGAMGGYGWSQNVHSNNVAVATDDLKGGFIGGTIGYNFQSAGSPLVFGVEADAAWASIKYSEPFLFGTTFEDKIQAIGSVTGRIGVAVDAALLYFKGGYAWGQNRLSVTGPLIGIEDTQLHSGWTVGGGLEYGFTPNVSLKAEYMYISLSDANYLATFVPGGLNLGVDLHTVKAGLNYRFGGPVVARY